MHGGNGDSRATEVDDLGRRELLAAFGEAERRDRRAQLDKLNLAYQWAVMNPGALDDQSTLGDGEPGPGSECEEPIAGEGSPLVARDAVFALAAAWGVSIATAQSMLADALDLRHRLQPIQALVNRLDLAPWKARRIASMTRSLSSEAAAWVAQELARRLPDAGFPTIEKVIAAAIAVFHPDRIDLDPKTAKDQWRVHLTQADGDTADNSYLDVTADTLDLVAFHDRVCAVAEALRLNGDDDSLDQRKAKALGLIGRGEDRELLAHVAEDSPARSSGAGSDADEDELVPAPRRTWKRRKAGNPTKLYVHVNASDLAGLDEPAPPTPVGYVERIGAVTIETIREWAVQPGVRIQPVIDLGVSGSVNCHDPPEWMAELVRLRDPHCVFPGCQRSSRTCDLDHIEAYDPDGPPGQTCPENLAPLCRGHHNAKTHLGWRYRRLPDGTYLWTSPDGLQYLVDVSKDVHVGNPPLI